MACKNITEALLEDVIEITWIFDKLLRTKEIKPWDILMEEFCGSDGIKQEIVKIAEGFEQKFPFDSTWEDGELDYIEEIEKFAEEKLIEVFGRKENKTSIENTKRKERVTVYVPKTFQGAYELFNKFKRMNLDFLDEDRFLKLYHEGKGEIGFCVRYNTWQVIDPKCDLFDITLVNM